MLKVYRIPNEEGESGFHVTGAEKIELEELAKDNLFQGSSALGPQPDKVPRGDDRHSVTARVTGNIPTLTLLARLRKRRARLSGEHNCTQRRQRQRNRSWKLEIPTTQRIGADLRANLRACRRLLWHRQASQ